MFRKKSILFVVVVALSAVSSYDVEEFDIKSRIVGGEASTRGQWPFYVFLETQLPMGRAKCGASLISNQWIVSAGHCLKGATNVTVHLGSLKALDLKEAGRKIIEVDAKGIFVHPRYFQLLVLK